MLKKSNDILRNYIENDQELSTLLLSPWSFYPYTFCCIAPGGALVASSILKSLADQADDEEELDLAQDLLKHSE